MLATAAARRWWILVAVFVLIAVPIQVGVTFLPELYQSTASILVEDQQIPSNFVRSTVTTVLATRIQAISQEVLSRSSLARLIERLDLFPVARAGGASADELAGTLRRDIRIDTRRSDQARTVAFSITCRGDDPQRVADVANAIADRFVEQNLEIRSAQASSTSEFLQTQLEEVQASLEEMEVEVGDFKSNYVGQLPHQQSANLATLAQLNTRLSMNGDKQLRLVERIGQLERQIQEASKNTDADSPDATAIRLGQLREQHRQLRLQYSDKYPDVVRLGQEIQALESRLQDSIAGSGVSEASVGAPNATTISLRKELDNAQLELKALVSEEETLQEQIATYDAHVKAAPLREQQFQVLMRDYETTSEMYRSLLVRQKEAEMAVAMEQKEKGERFEILDYALPATGAAAPDLPRLRMVGLALAIAVAVGLVVLLEVLDGSYHSLRELQADSEIPILGVIPEIVTSGDRRRRARWFVLGFCSTLFLVVAASAASYKICLDNYQIVGMLMR